MFGVAGVATGASSDTYCCCGAGCGMVCLRLWFDWPNAACPVPTLDERANLANGGDVSASLVIPGRSPQSRNHLPCASTPFSSLFFRIPGVIEMRIHPDRPASMSVSRATPASFPRAVTAGRQEKTRRSRNLWTLSDIKNKRGESLKINTYLPHPKFAPNFCRFSVALNRCRKSRY